MRFWKASLCHSARKVQKRLEILRFQVFFGPSDWIRTSGLLNPIQARYQTSPHPDMPYLVASLSMIAHFPQTCKPFFHFSGKFLSVVRGPPFPPEEAAGQPAKPPRASGIRRLTRGGSLAVFSTRLPSRLSPPGTSPPAGKGEDHLAYSTTLVSRITWTLIWPGYSSSFSMRLASSRARMTI